MCFGWINIESLLSCSDAFEMLILFRYFVVSSFIVASMACTARESHWRSSFDTFEPIRIYDLSITYDVALFHFIHHPTNNQTESTDLIILYPILLFNIVIQFTNLFDAIAGCSRSAPVWIDESISVVWNAHSIQHPFHGRALYTINTILLLFHYIYLLWAY